MTLEDARKRLPPPFDAEPFQLLRRGTYDSPTTDVFVNDKSDFAFLHPTPTTDYVAYRPRVKTLGLRDYKKSLSVVERRFEKIRGVFTGIERALEIGASDAAFLTHAHGLFPHLSLACVEVDQTTKPARDQLPGLRQYESLAEIAAEGAGFDLVCLFHVLEHILDPHEFLRECTACLSSGGRIVIEVPSLDDPLLSLYRSEPYAAFYFQQQHPYVYSASSLARLIETTELQTEAVIHHQRYGVENHLHWLTEGKPGGSTALRDVFEVCDESYRHCLERSGHADAVILVARAGR